MACRIIVSAQSQSLSFGLWILDFDWGLEFGTWIWDLDVGLRTWAIQVSSNDDDSMT